MMVWASSIRLPYIVGEIFLSPCLCFSYSIGMMLLASMSVRSFITICFVRVASIVVTVLFYACTI